MKKMKRTRLTIGREVVRALTAKELATPHGGIPVTTVSVVDACYTDIYWNCGDSWVFCTPD